MNNTVQITFNKVYGEATSQKIKKAREEKEKGLLTTITPDNLWTQAK